MITPPAKVIEALLGVPGALAEGVANLLSGGQSSLRLQTQSVNAMAAPAPEAPEAGTQRRALAAVTEPKVEAEPSSVDTGLTADAKPQAVEADKTVGDTTVADTTVADTTVGDTTVGEKAVAEKKTPDAKEPPKTANKKITHPTVTSDGNKVTPTNTTIGTPTGNSPVVELVPTSATNSPEKKANSTPTGPTAASPDPVSTTVDAKDDTTHQTADDAAA